MRRSLAILIVTLLAAPVAASDRARPGDDGANVLLTLTIAGSGGDARGTGERSIRALLLDDQRTRLTSGWRVPTATELSAEPGGNGQPTSVAYQDVGLGATLHSRMVAPGRLRVAGEIELSSIDESKAGAALGPSSPVVSTFRQVFEVVLRDGVSATLGELPHPEGGAVSLTILAQIQE